MAKLPQLIADLERLNTNYLELSKPSFPQTKEDVKKKKKNALKAGQLFVDFYNKVFVPQYSKSAEIPKVVLDKIEPYLSYLSSTASGLINEKVYFGLSVLLINRGDRIGNPNNLEKIIKDLKRAK
jgi:hypothetical protein